jgi:hypothetical protein
MEKEEFVDVALRDDITEEKKEDDDGGMLTAADGVVGQNVVRHLPLQHNVQLLLFSSEKNMDHFSF